MLWVPRPGTQRRTRSRPSVQLWDLLLSSLRPLALRLPRVLGCKQHPEASGGQGGGRCESSASPGAHGQVSGCKVFVRFLFSGRTEPSPGDNGCAHSPWRCRPRKWPSDRPCPGGGGGGGGDKAAGGGDGRRARGCARTGSAPARRAGSGSGSTALGPRPRPRLAHSGPARDPPTRPRPLPAIGRRAGVGRSRQVRVLLFCFCGGAAGPVLCLQAPLAARAPGPAGAEDPPQTPRLRVPKLTGAGPETLGPRLSSGGPRQDYHLSLQGVRGAGRGGGGSSWEGEWKGKGTSLSLSLFFPVVGHLSAR